MSKVIVERAVSPEALPEDSGRVGAEKAPGDSVRPLSFADYCGQEDVKDNLSVYVEAAKKRDKQLELEYDVINHSHHELPSLRAMLRRNHLVATICLSLQT